MCPCSSTGTSRRSGSRPTSRSSRRTRFATRASRSPSWLRRTRRRRWRPSRRSTSSYEERTPLFDIRKAFDARRAQGAPVGQLVPALRRRDGPPPDPQGIGRGRVRQGGHDRPGRLPAGRDRARAARDAGRARRARGERAPHDLLLHAGALLLDGRRRGAPAGAAQQAEGRRRDGRRRLRRQGRHRERDDVRAPRAEVGPPREVALDARGGVPLLVDPGALAHGDRGRGDEGRLDPRSQDADAARLGRLRALLALRAHEALLPPHGRLHDPEPGLRRLRRVHESECRRPPCAGSASRPSRSRRRPT